MVKSQYLFRRNDRLRIRLVHTVQQYPVTGYEIDNFTQGEI